MKKFYVGYEIQYRGLTIVGEEQHVEAYSQEEAESDTRERILDNMIVVVTARGEDEDD